MKNFMPKNGIFEMPALSFEASALDGVISSKTLDFHYGKHLKAYVDNMNKMLPNSGYEGLDLVEIVKRADGAMFNNAGQVLNHAMYFEQFTAKRENNQPSGKLLQLIERDFGSFDAFRKEFEQKGVGLFGSGWVWLSQNAEGKLVITQEQNANNPVRSGLVPLLTFDVWEHAYYIDYQNRRADHLAALWSIIDWNVIEKRLS